MADNTTTVNKAATPEANKATAKDKGTVYELERNGRKYRTMNKGEAQNMVYAQGYKLNKPAKFD